MKRSFLLLSALPLFAGLNLENLSLEEAENIALSHNKTFRIAEERTFEANERRLQAISKFLPSLGYKAEFRDIEKPELFFNVFSNTDFTLSHRGYSSILELNQPLFSTDLIFNLKTSDFDTMVYRFYQGHTRNELLLAVRDQYYSVLYYQKMLEIERENIDYLAYALRQDQGKLDAGNFTPFELNQSKSALANAISLYYATLKDLKTARNRLVLTLGIDPLLEKKIYLKEDSMPIESTPEIADKLKQIGSLYRYQSKSVPSTEDYLNHIRLLENATNLTVFSEKELEYYLDMARRLRPDLLAKKAEVDVADQKVNQKYGTYLPKLGGYVRYSYNDIDLGERPFFDQPYNFSAGLVLSWNIFDSLLREHEVKEAKSKRASSNIAYDRQWQKIEVEVRDGLYLLEEAMLTYLSTTQAVFVAEQAREQAEDKLRFGKIAPLNYRDAVNHLFQAKNQQNKASFDLLAAYFQVRYATGIDTQ